MKRTTLAFLALLPLAASCASQKVIDDYEAELAALREERTSLRAENQDLRGQLDQTAIALSNASGDLEAARAQAASAPTLPEFADGIEVGMRGGDMVIVVPSSITFGSGKASLSSGGKTALEEVATVLKRDHPNAEYWIEGHTDSDPIKKSGFKSNRDLSLARAMSVLTFFVEDCGVPDDSCRVVGVGQYKPLADNATPEGKAKNRRVEIVVHE